jgi:hypothetical protein
MPQLKVDLDHQLEFSLDILAQNEELRLNTLKDALRRMVVVETSLVCNRQYDMGSLPKVMEEVQVVRLEVDRVMLRFAEFSSISLRMLLFS